MVVPGEEKLPKAAVATGAAPPLLPLVRLARGLKLAPLPKPEKEGAAAAGPDAERAKPWNPLNAPVFSLCSRGEKPCIIHTRPTEGTAIRVT